MREREHVYDDTANFVRNINEVDAYFFGELSPESLRDVGGARRVRGDFREAARLRERVFGVVAAFSAASWAAVSAAFSQWGQRILLLPSSSTPRLGFICSP